MNIAPNTHRPNYSWLFLWSAKSDQARERKSRKATWSPISRYWRCEEEEETDEKFRAVVSVWKLNANSIHFILFCCCLFSIVGQEIGCWRARSSLCVCVCVCCWRFICYLLWTFHLTARQSSRVFFCHIFLLFFFFISLIHSFFSFRFVLIWLLERACT